MNRRHIRLDGWEAGHYTGIMPARNGAANGLASAAPYRDCQPAAKDTVKGTRAIPVSVYLGVLLFVTAPPGAAYSTGDQVTAAPSDGLTINVRNGQLPDLPVIGQQYRGVHGEIIGSPVVGSAGGFTGNWWPIRWDAGDWQGGPEGWSAESAIAPASAASHVSLPDLELRHYTTDNRFWTDRLAPASTDPPGGSNLGTALGNCTWYAYGRMLELGYDAAQLRLVAPPNQGNAHQWIGNAASGGIALNQSPRIGSIAVKDISPGFALGHVAVVETLNGDNMITVTESSWASDNPAPNTPWNFLWRRRTVEPAWFNNYIHLRRSPGQAWTISIVPQRVSYSVGSPVTIEGLLTDDLDRPIAGHPIIAQDPFFRQTRIAGLTAPDGRFRLQYNGSLTAFAGAGVYRVNLAAEKARATVVINLDPEQPAGRSFAAETLRLN